VASEQSIVVSCETFYYYMHVGFVGCQCTVDAIKDGANIKDASKQSFEEKMWT
jgi:hypothetical protein